MIKKIYPIVSLFVLCFFLVSWGGVGHRTISSKAYLSFPSSMVGFNAWATPLTDHASDADTRKSSDPNESPKHFLDIENYAEFVSTGRIALTYDSVVTKHGASWVINNGTLPWATLDTYNLLVDDFKKLNWSKAVLDAADLGHYVGDGHQPLHISANYDGQKTGQKGIHSRYESDLVADYLSDISNYTGSSVQVVTNVNSYIFAYIYKNHKYLDSVLIADTYATSTAGDNTSSTYYAALWSKTQFTTTLFKNASHALAELIYTAWVAGGSPAYGATALSQINGNIISVYPNPTKGIITMESDNILKTEVCGVTGKSLGSFTGKQIDLSNLANGLYILNIYAKEGLLQKEKIMLAR